MPIWVWGAVKENIGFFGVKGVKWRKMLLVRQLVASGQRVRARAAC